MDKAVASSLTMMLSAGEAAMAASFEKKSRSYADTPDIIFNPTGVYFSKTNNNIREDSKIVKTDINKVVNRNNIPDDMLWLLK